MPCCCYNGFEWPIGGKSRRASARRRRATTLPHDFLSFTRRLATPWWHSSWRASTSSPGKTRKQRAGTPLPPSDFGAHSGGRKPRKLWLAWARPFPWRAWSLLPCPSLLSTTLRPHPPRNLPWSLASLLLSKVWCRLNPPRNRPRARRLVPCTGAGAAADVGVAGVAAGSERKAHHRGLKWRARWLGSPQPDCPRSMRRKQPHRPAWSGKEYTRRPSAR